MKKILILKEKHGDYAYDISTPEKSDNVYLKIFTQRKEEGWYDDFSDTPAFEIQDGKTARKIILQRSQKGYEYEEVEEMIIQEI